MPPTFFRRPAVRGAIGGALWSLPFAVFSAWVCWKDPRHFDLLGAILVGLGVFVVWSGIAAFVAWQRANRKPRTPREAVAEAEVRKAAISATIYSSPVVLFMVATTWGYNPGGALISAAMLQGMWVGSAMIVGLVRGKSKARQMT